MQGNKIEPIEESLAADEESPDEKAKNAVDEEDEEGDLPDLFSLRRSPFYQIKIDQKQLGDNILITRDELLENLQHASACEYDIRKTLVIDEFA